jgi:hypothetical protein
MTAVTGYPSAMATKANAKVNSNSKAKAGPGKAQKKGRSSGGRTTAAASKVQGQRYTPPVPKNVKTSPRWLGILILALFGLGVLVVILNYAGVLPGGVNNLWLIAAIGAIFAGLILATRYH